MDKTEIYTQVTNCIRDMLNEDVDIKMESELEKLITDSLTFAEFVLDLEDQFDLAFEDADVEELTTVANCVDYIEKLLAKEGR